MKESVLSAFAEQGRLCVQFGSPFTAQLCAAFSERLDDSTAIGHRLINWHGDPSAKADSLPLRVAGALHALARDGSHRELAACYPPNPPPDANRLWSAITRCLDSELAHFEQYLREAPQTNEVGRSTLLMAGLLEIANRTRTRLRLFEIGSSAGLNLVLDRYRYCFGNARWGDPNARLCLQPIWTGDPPPIEAPIDVAGRSGVDLNPLDLRSPHARARLISYVWADQTERIGRLEAAIEAALLDPPMVERMDAADWLEARMHVDGELGVTQVLMHSIVWSYLADFTQARIEAHLLACAARSSTQRRVAWIRFELDPSANTAVLRATVWPQNQTVDLARAHPHGSSVEYLAHLAAY